MYLISDEYLDVYRTVFHDTRVVWKLGMGAFKRPRYHSKQLVIPLVVTMFGVIASLNIINTNVGGVVLSSYAATQNRVRNRLYTEPFLMIPGWFESWDSGLSNHPGIIKNGSVYSRLRARFWSQRLYPTVYRTVFNGTGVLWKPWVSAFKRSRYH